MPLPQTWGVTAEEVSALAPHITIKATKDEQLIDDPVFGATQPRAITRDQVEGFIKDVAARVALRTVKIGLLLSPDTKEMFAQAAHDLVVNGAASYLVAAAFPAKAGLNDQSSLSAELWNRFTVGLDQMVATLDELTAPGAEDPGTPEATTGLTKGFFQPAQFPDAPVAGTYRDCPYPGSWNW